jgi:hypothetical protein
MNMNRRQKMYGALALLTAVGFGAATGLPALAQVRGGGPGMGPGGMPCPMMLEWFDEDGDGKVTLEEFRSGHDERLVEIDANGDGKVTIEEFQAAPKPSRQAQMQRMFQRMDGNGDGTLSREELAARSQARFQGLDTNGDNVITADELQQAAPAKSGAGKGPGGATPPANPQ